MKTPLQLLLPVLAAAAAVLGSGCVAIPMGTEMFTTEYPSEIRATADPPTKTYEASVSAASGDEDNRTVMLGLMGEITIEQPQEQHYEQGGIEKRKYLAFGFFPNAGSFWNNPPTNILHQQSLPYQGNGVYSTMQLKNPPKEKPNGSLWWWNAGADSENQVFFGIFNTPFSLLFGAFMPYERDRHYFGRYLSCEWKTNSNGNQYLNSTYREEDIELLLRFSQTDREKIGAWTYHEDAEHPHNTFANAFDRSALFGFYKWCYYVVHDPQETSKTTRADPKITEISKSVPGPYFMQISLPTLGYDETAEVDSAAISARILINVDSSAV